MEAAQRQPRPTAPFIRNSVRELRKRGRKHRKPCNEGYGPHEGRMIPLENQVSADDPLAGFWAETFTCSKCSSTVHRSRFLGAA